MKMNTMKTTVKIVPLAVAMSFNSACKGPQQLATAPRPDLPKYEIKQGIGGTSTTEEAGKTGISVNNNGEPYNTKMYYLMLPTDWANSLYGGKNVSATVTPGEASARRPGQRALISWPMYCPGRETRGNTRRLMMSARFFMVGRHHKRAKHPRKAQWILRLTGEEHLCLRLSVERKGH